MKLSPSLLMVLLPAVRLAAQCPPPVEVARLDTSLYESSGLAPSLRRPGLFWTVVDSDGDSAVFAVDLTGALRQRVRVAGAANRDWEEMASGACPGGTGHCLWIADTGDNLERHEDARLYVIPEPLLGDTVSAPARLFRARFPDGARDAEALFVTPDGQPYLISKGRNGHPVQLHLFPLGEQVGRLVPLQTLAPRADLLHSVTGAASAADGSRVAVRSYSEFTLYRVRGRGTALRLDEIPGTRTPFVQHQGESVAFGADGLYFTSEVPPGQAAPLARTVCPAPAALVPRGTER